ncbi:hypothetical protein [Micromonospora sp. LA-10]|uniref:hypothetical protein n=1 Tax=Micromonospora sp. LA-10 TaxID=3446364 RepID=UPI003F705F2A
MPFGRWVLLSMMMLLGPLLWWSGVEFTAADAYAALPPGDASLPDLVATYRSGAITIMAFFVLLNLALVLIAVPSERDVRQGRSGTITRAVVGTVLVTALVWFEYRFSPAGHDWSGDPDARSTVRDHLHPWHPAVLGLWVALHTAVAASIAVRAGQYRARERRAAHVTRRPPARQASTGSGP